ncbi:MAG: hypothetical protein Q4E99_02615 [Bacillota bacterium]|nr:hypothetical protein [Bacillota bacterium]
MNINFYKTKSPNNYCNKVLTDLVTINGSLIYPMDVCQPQLKVKASAINNYMHYNYCSFSFGGKTRYYYVQKQMLENEVLYLDLVEDTLMTYRADLLNSYAHITRSNQGNKYLPDDMCLQTNLTNWQSRKIGRLAESGSFYVLVKGGN